MVTNKGYEHKKHVPLNAACVNLMAQFIHIARKVEGKTLHLQDRDVLQKMSLIAHKTSDKKLVELHNQLRIELRKQDQALVKKNTTSSSLVDNSNDVIKNLVDWAKSL